MSAWRRRRVEESSPAEDGHHGGAADDAGAETEEVRDVTVPDLFADRASEPSLADQEWAEAPRGGPPEDHDLTEVAEPLGRPPEETAVLPPAGAETMSLDEPALVEPPPSRGAWIRDLRLTSMTLYVVAFLCLLGAAGAVAVAQFTASTKAPWVSVGLSGAAVVLTVASLLVRSWP